MHPYFGDLFRADMGMKHMTIFLLIVIFVLNIVDDMNSDKLLGTLNVSSLHALWDNLHA